MKRDLLAAGIVDPELQASYETCRRLNAQHGKTYYLATLLLPPAKRPFVHALYGLARYADDIVDSAASTGTAADRNREFTRWSDAVRTELRTGRGSGPVTRAVVDTAQRFELPIELFEAFFASMAMDLSVNRYDTFTDLERYMWGSAAVIGLQMLPILGRGDPAQPWDELRPYAIDLGLAFQLTNFVRDVGEDLDRDRIYLPMESLDRFGVTAADLGRRRPTPAIRALVASEVGRARGFYARARPGLALVERTSRPCLHTAFVLYGGILDEIERADYDVFTRRAQVPLRRRAAVAAPQLVSAWRARRTDDPTRPRA
jgi:15-cis-phytoene synthase